MPIWETI
jgi:hypothetical protein